MDFGNIRKSMLKTHLGFHPFGFSFTSTGRRGFLRLGVCAHISPYGLWGWALLSRSPPIDTLFCVGRFHSDSAVVGASPPNIRPWLALTAAGCESQSNNPRLSHSSDGKSHTHFVSFWGLFLLYLSILFNTRRALSPIADSSMGSIFMGFI